MIVQDFFTYVKQTPGALQLYPSAMKMLATWGMLSETAKTAVIDCMTNRIYGRESDPSALLEEFRLPNHEKLLKNKMDWCEQRGCVGAIFGMLNAIGHPNVSVYSYMPATPHRTDSPYCTPGGIPDAALTGFPYERYSNIFPQWTHTDSTAVMQHSFVVAIWDCVTNSTVAQPRLGAVTVGQNLGHSGPNQGQLSVFYTGEENQQVIKDIVKFGSGAESVPLEVFFCYPNSITGQGSTFDLRGDPTSGNDIVEKMLVNMSDFS
jgi:hypothetical protein